MLVLGIDTSTKVASGALTTGDKLLGETYLHTGNDHSSHLMPLIESLFKLCGKTPRDLTGIAVAIGPGSFTGLRIGLATGKALASALEIPLLGIPTLDALAHNLAGADGIICPILDARKQQVYTACYTRNSKGLERLTPYLAISPQELVDKLGEFSAAEQIHFLGDGLPVYGEQLAQALSSPEMTSRRVVMTPQPNSLARSSQVAWLGVKELEEQREEQAQSGSTGVDTSYHHLTPMYLRDSEAEVNLKREQERSRCGTI